MNRLMMPGVASIMLAGCATNSAYEPPIVDMTNVDPVRYNNDLGQCTEAKQDLGPVSFGAPIGARMAQRDYTIIAKRG
jgi:hypothetical protein